MPSRPFARRGRTAEKYGFAREWMVPQRSLKSRMTVPVCRTTIAIRYGMRSGRQRVSGRVTGLGLTVVRDIVSSHGGEISIAVPIGGDVRDGARFVVRLPALHCRSAHDFDILDQQATRALDVLVVDSNTQNTAFLAAFLSSRGHAALTASDIGYALHLADHLPFDAVICDSSIANGNAELAALRAAPGCLNARFIVAAGDAKSMTRLTFPLPPATGLVMRPYDLEELRVLLED